MYRLISVNQFSSLHCRNDKIFNHLTVIIQNNPTLIMIMCSRAMSLCGDLHREH